jgi:hypothetical protein
VAIHERQKVATVLCKNMIGPGYILNVGQDNPLIRTISSVSKRAVQVSSLAFYRTGIENQPLAVSELNGTSSI